MCRLYFRLCLCCWQCVAYNMMDRDVCPNLFWGKCVYKSVSCYGLYVCPPCRLTHADQICPYSLGSRTLLYSTSVRLLSCPHFVVSLECDWHNQV